jgi:phage-related protein
MSYPTFPPIAPDSNVERQIEAQTTEQNLGDGYTYRVTFGLHPMTDDYRIKFDLINSDVSIITSFLEARAHDGIPFLWVTPESVAGTNPFAELWKCRSWPVTRDGPIRSTIEVQLERQWSYVRDA